MMRYVVFVLIIFHSCFTINSFSKSIVKRLPGYPGDLPFILETGYVGIGEKEDVQVFYYLVESTRNSEEDPIIFHFPGGPGASGLLSLLTENYGPLILNIDDLTLKLNPNTWTQMANVVFVDIPAGAGFSYAEAKEGWISSDTKLATQMATFTRKFVSEHPKLFGNPIYISGISYHGLIVPKTTLELYEANERGEDPIVNIQGYLLCNPLTDKFMDFNSRFEFAHRVGLISDDIHKLGIENCHGNYVDNPNNLLCAKSLQRFEECTRYINIQNILAPFCEESTPVLADCEVGTVALDKWANKNDVQQALNIDQGKIGKWEAINYSIHWAYHQEEKETRFYSYDIFSSFWYHKKLSTKNCQALIFSGDHDLTFPYVGVEKWITSLHVEVEQPWTPFYVDNQVGGYVTRYAQNSYSMTFATVKGAGHTVTSYKPKEAMVLVQGWLSSRTHFTDS